MPIYAYQCGACGFAKDQLQKITDPALTDCPQCGKPTLTKLLTAPGFQLKGSGWYATDFKNNSAAPATSTQDSTTQTPAAPGGETSPSPMLISVTSATVTSSTGATVQFMNAKDWAAKWRQEDQVFSQIIAQLKSGK